jgi:Tol biopolymer transport system component
VRDLGRGTKTRLTSDASSNLTPFWSPKGDRIVFTSNRAGDFPSDRSGRREVYVRPFPPSEGEWTISLAGGQAPRWRGDGKELFFEAADGKMMAVAVKAVTGKTLP